ncbi:hypothetical protein CEXT_505911 [Caerostris extrusa]|uniref:Uncharacterized protein n=1 Tax=Caerostris extrusa TaxID=172846 RepID=A0AAV4YD49_CAEEX|nr:hypothetical protein CEXT_505911 [Caerostris extrusa]
MYPKRKERNQNKNDCHDTEAQVNANVLQKKKIFIFTFIPSGTLQLQLGKDFTPHSKCSLRIFLVCCLAQISIVRQTKFYFMEQLHIHAYFLPSHLQMLPAGRQCVYPNTRLALENDSFFSPPSLPTY